MLVSSMLAIINKYYQFEAILRKTMTKETSSNCPGMSLRRSCLKKKNASHQCKKNASLKAL